MLPARYQDVAWLGEGAFGQVYRARDDQGRPAAVKVLAAERAHQPESAWQFAAEYRTLARLDHPAFPAAFEEGRTPAGLPFYAMALVDGSSPGAGPLPAAEVRAWIAGLAEALGYLHGLGLVHGDVKPDNMRRGADGRVHLLDVGMVTVAGQPREAIAGTLEYLAPEAFRRQPIDPRADLYALGVVAYELWTGAAPFQGNPAALVRAQLTERPASLAGRTPDADEALEALIFGLLAKEPAARPQTAGAVLVALGAAEPDAAVTLPGLQGGAFVGRDGLMAAWDALLDGLAGEQGQAAGPFLAIAAPLGLGKSRALDECRVAAQLVGVTWASASCTGAADAPAAPLRAVVGQAIAAARLTPDEDLAAWLAGGVPERLLELEPAARKAVLAGAAASALETAARSLGGLAVGLDDWHLADGASRELLAAWARTLAGAPLRWAIAYAPSAVDAANDAEPIAENAGDAAKANGNPGEQPGAGDSTPPASAAEARGPSGAASPAAPASGAPASTSAPETQAIELPFAGHPVPLLPLTDEEARILLASRLGTDVPDALAADLLPAAQGSPLWLHALLEQAQASGALTRTTDGWRYAPTARAAAPGVKALWAARLATAGDDARRLAAVLALAARAGELPVGALTAASGVADDALDALLSRGVVVVKDGRARLAMAAAAPSLVEALNEAERPAIAQRLVAAVLGDTPLAEVNADRLIQATWLALAGGPALELATEAGRRALALAAPAEAMQLLVAAAPGLKGASQPAALRFLEARGEAARLLDRLDEAIPDFEQALTLADDPALKASLLVALAKCRQMRGAYPEALDLLAQADPLGDDAMRARIAAAEARLRLFRGEQQAALDCCDRAIALSAGPGATAIRAKALTMKGVLVVQADPTRLPAALSMLEEAVRLNEALRDRLGEGVTFENLGNVYLSAGHLAEAARAFERAGMLFDEVGSATDALGALLNQAICAGDLGDVDRARVLAADVAARAGRIGRKFFVAVARAVEGQVAWRAARPADAKAPLDEALAIAVEIKSRYLEEHVRLARLEAWLALGDREGARQEAVALEAIVAATNHADAQQRLAVHRAELTRQQGDATAAIALAEPLLDHGPVVAHRARQVLALASLAAGDGAAALDHARIAKGIATDWQAPWHVEADAWLEVRALCAVGEARIALTLARLAMEDPIANRFARAGLALSLVEHDDGPAARTSLEAALAGLRPGILAMEPSSWPPILEAQGLAAVTGRLERRHEPIGGMGTGGHVDPAAYAMALGELAVQHDEVAIGQVALRSAMALVGAERGYFLAYEDGSLRQAITEGLDYEAELADGFSHSIAGEVLFSGQPLYVADASANAEWREAQSVAALGLRTVVCLPVAVPDQILGVLYMDRQAIDPVLTPGDVAFMTGFATATASAILRERGRILAELRQHEFALQARLAVAIASTPQRAHDELLDAALDLAGAERGFLLQKDGETWTATSARTAQQRPLAFRPDLISSGIADWVAEHGEPIALLDAASAEGWKARQSLQALGLRTVWCLPLPHGGLLYMDTTELAIADPAAPLEALQALLAFAGPLLRP